MRRRLSDYRSRISAPCFALLYFSVLLNQSAAVPLLPDMIVWAEQAQFPSRCYMYCGFMDTGLIDNKVLYRFHGALPNVGPGPLEIREVTHPDATQDVYQRIYQSEGGINEVLIGSFPGAASLPPRHLWLPGIAQYNLRTVTEGNGLGPVVSSHDKVSMAVVDSRAYNSSLPGAPPSPVYGDISAAILGISIGYADVYPTGLPGQWVEATGLPDGQYWLEVIADPYNRIQESDESNNTTRVMVNLVVPDPLIHPGDYDDAGTVDAADYVVWRNTLGQNVPNDTQGNPALGSGGDGDGDGVIGLPDYDVWRARFGEVAASAASLESGVPEPSTLFYSALAVAQLLLGLRRRCGRNS